MAKLTYEAAVRRLVQDYYDAFDLKDIEVIIESGLRGIRQLTNEEIVSEFDFRFSETLAMLDPESNPNVTLERLCAGV